MPNEPKIRKKFLEKLHEVKITPEGLVLTQPIRVRIFHWGFAFCMISILLSGFELNKPVRFLALNYGKVFMVHVTFCWLALGFLAFRITDAIIKRDKSLIPKICDLKSFPKLLSYYLFHRSNPPLSEKYNSGQKLVFFSWIILFIIASIFGFTSYWQGANGTWIIIRIFDGLQMVRWSKFVIAVYFASTIPLHIYLSVTEDLSKLQAMVTGYERV